MAIFKRKHKRKPHQHLREYIWPSQGWRRTARYYYHRIFRSGDSAHNIAGGLALGAAVSFTPFLGTHILQAIFFSFIFRFNWGAAVVGTLWGNPWTFPFLFWASYTIGVWIVGLVGLGAVVALPDSLDFEMLLRNPKDFMSYLFAHPVKILLPFGIGGYVAGALFGLVAYGALYYPVKLMRKSYHG